VNKVEVWEDPVFESTITLSNFSPRNHCGTRRDGNQDFRASALGSHLAYGTLY
jgi:hypothetical protein